MSNLQLRIVSAILLIPVVFGAIILGSYYFGALVLLIGVLAFREWISLSRKTDNPAGFMAFGVLYLLIGLAAFFRLRTGFDDGLYFVSMMLIVVWASDTGAYFVGRAFGKTKMAPSISPNKSWEGMAGSMISAALAFMALVYFAPRISAFVPNIVSTPELHELPYFLIIGAALGYIGQAGDLLESFLKRRAGAKDSGRAIPGHGGILDRVDSILLIAPVFIPIAHYVLQSD